MNTSFTNYTNLLRTGDFRTLSRFRMFSQSQTYLLRKRTESANFAKNFLTLSLFRVFSQSQKYLLRKPTESANFAKNFRTLSLFRVFSQSKKIF